MSVETCSLATGNLIALERRGLFARLAGLGRLVVAVLLALTPVTAILVLGWLLRLMQREEALARAQLQRSGRRGRSAALPTWLCGGAEPAHNWRQRWFGGLAENIRSGIASLATVALGTLPFSLVWLLSWWGGWENSFNKGYEQAWVGPSLGLIGVAVALPLLARLPMALAHQAVEGRAAAFFRIREVRLLIRLAGWRYVWLAFLCVAAAFPLFVLKSAPVFVEQWRPGLLDRNLEEVEAFANSYRLWATAYLVAALVFLRRYAAGLHARAALKLVALPQSRTRSATLGGMLRAILLWIIWFGLVAQVFVGQFVSHQWVSWVNHPLIALPWLPPLGAPV